MFIEGSTWDGSFSTLTRVTLVSRSDTEKSSSGVGGSRSRLVARSRSEKQVAKISSSFMPHLPALAKLFRNEDD